MKCVIWRLGVLACLLAVISPAHSQIYRCINPAGEITFTQHQCPPNQHSEAVNLGHSDVDRKSSPAVCKQLAKLANLIFPHISDTDSILDMYQDLGGRASLSAGVTAAVNYVYNFRYNPKASRSNVVTLTHEKCLDGGFGAISEQELPEWSKIKYTQGDTANPEDAKLKPAEQRKSCEQTKQKLSEARQRLAEAKDKGRHMQARLDVEYYENLLGKQCHSEDKNPDTADNTRSQ